MREPHIGDAPTNDFCFGRPPLSSSPSPSNFSLTPARRGPIVRLWLTAGTRQVPKPRKQRCEMRPVLLLHGREFQSKSVARLNMRYDRLGPELSFLDEKIDLAFHSHRPWTWVAIKQTSRTKVPDA